MKTIKIIILLIIVLTVESCASNCANKSWRNKRNCEVIQ